MMELQLSLIRTDGGTQPRVQINRTVISDYAEQMLAGAMFPPVTVFFDGQDYWLADGFHRLSAAKKTGAKTIQANVHEGQQRDAILYAVGVNADHGLRRTNADKRQAVEILLADPEWTQWSDREIARRCAVSDRFVNNVRKQFTPAGTHPSGSGKSHRKVYRNGTVYTLNTSNIGRSSSSGKNAQPLSATAKPSAPTRKYASNLNTAERTGRRPTSDMHIRCLDVRAAQQSQEEPETFAIQSQSLRAEIVCSPSIMADLLQRVRDYPGFVETLLKHPQLL